MNVFIDIETIPEQPEEKARARIAETIKAPAAMKKVETIDAWHNGEGKYAGEKDKAIDDAYRKTSFDGAKGQICSIAWEIEGHDLTSTSDKDWLEADMLKHFFNDVKILCRGRPPYFIGQYIGGFDLKFLFHRAVILGIEPPFKIPFDGRHGKDFYCTQAAWAGFGGRMSQDNLCKTLGIEGKPDDIDGSKVWDFYKAGKIERIEEYNRDDVQKIVKIYNRINFIGATQ